MSTVFDTVMMVFLGLVMVCAFVAMGYALWSPLPPQGQERLAVALRRLSGRRVSIRSGPPISAVHVDGQLLYASGKEDVQDYLFGLFAVAGRQVLRLVDEGRPATMLLTCGEESIVIEVHLA